MMLMLCMAQTHNGCLWMNIRKKYIEKTQQFSPYLSLEMLFPAVCDCYISSSAKKFSTQNINENVLYANEKKALNAIKS